MKRKTKHTQHKLDLQVRSVCYFDLDRNYENTQNKMFIRLSVTCIQERELKPQLQ
jgi:hypothetical protein